MKPSVMPLDLHAASEPKGSFIDRLARNLVMSSLEHLQVGRLSVEENPEGGSIFRFTLPLAAPGEVNENPAA